MDTLTVGCKDVIAVYLHIMYVAEGAFRNQLLISYRGDLDFRSGTINIELIVGWSNRFFRRHSVAIH
jgi:hypothetical protein